jgi:hypothetical protein
MIVNSGAAENSGFIQNAFRSNCFRLVPREIDRNPIQIRRIKIRGQCIPGGGYSFGVLPEPDVKTRWWISARNIS